jgi:2-polyprenyl-3-methyl-5-hydroxy-6-metoxy-1,4-benzoquinol methylase
VSLDPSSVGVDHNPFSIQAARDSGFQAYTADEFFASSQLAVPHSFDSMLVAHVLEHLEPEQMVPIISMYLPMIKPGGRVVWITPQERGFASDATHLTFVDHVWHKKLSHELGLELGRQYSFPFPRPVGKVFTYNEFVSVLSVPTSPS